MILILDFGSQYTQLIARRVREARVYCEIHPYSVAAQAIRELQPEGIILSGGPASVYEANAPMLEATVVDTPVPFLGICYGMGVLHQLAGAEIAGTESRE
jgi:GMP synthase (glutamine-hydrolysing)